MAKRHNVAPANPAISLKRALDMITSSGVSRSLGSTGTSDIGMTHASRPVTAELFRPRGLDYPLKRDCRAGSRAQSPLRELRREMHSALWPRQLRPHFHTKVATDPAGKS